MMTKKKKNSILSKVIPPRRELWNRTPAVVRKMIRPVVGAVPEGILLGRKFRRQMAFANDCQWWARNSWEEHNLEKIQSMCTLAYDSSDYYRRVFDNSGFHPRDMKSLNDFSKIPTIDKHTVSEHLPRMLTVPADSRQADYCSTGGTGGTPLSFYINSDRSPTEYGYLLAGWQRSGYKLGMPMAVLRGRKVSANRNGLHHEYDPILRHHYYSSFHMSDENLGRYLDHMATIGPCYLHVYPSTAAALARFILRSGVNAPKNIEGILAESEIVYPQQRKLVEKVFGCRCFSSYGQTEKVVLAAACEASNDYHVWPTYGHFELVDADGNQVTTPGERGDIVGTGFVNTVTPFIRYRTGDRATYVGDRCQSCGREHTLIRDIRGHRTQEMLIAADGSEIPWAAVNMHDDTFIRVMQFQFLQEEAGQAVVRIVPAEGFCEHDRDRIQRNLGHKLNGRLTLTVELTEAIPLSPRGKATYVEQRIALTSRRADSRLTA